MADVKAVYDELLNEEPIQVALFGAATFRATLDALQEKYGDDTLDQTIQVLMEEFSNQLDKLGDAVFLA